MAKIGKLTYFEEREHIVCGRIGVGDITKWSKGVSRPFGSQFKPVRPLCDGKVFALKQNPITSLKAIKPIDSKPLPHDSSKVVLPGKGRNTIDLSDGNKIDELMARRAAKRLLASENFNNLYAGKIAMKGEVKEFA